MKFVLTVGNLLKHGCNRSFPRIAQPLKLAVPPQQPATVDAGHLISHLPGNTRRVNLSFPIPWDLKQSLKRQSYVGLFFLTLVLDRAQALQATQREMRGITNFLIFLPRSPSSVQPHGVACRIPIMSFVWFLSYPGGVDSGKWKCYILGRGKGGSQQNRSSKMW